MLRASGKFICDLIAPAKLISFCDVSVCVRFPLDVIKVTQQVPLFSREEAGEVVAKAEAEGVDKNEFKSGKYQLAGKL